MITCTIRNCDYMDFILFSLRSTFSYVSVKFTLGWYLRCELLNAPMYESTPIRVSMFVYLVYRACLVMFMGIITLLD